MGLLDRIFAALLLPLRPLFVVADGLEELVGEQEQASETVGQTIEQAQPLDETAEVLVDTVEEFILADLQEQGQLDPDNVEAVADDLEGNATAVLAGVAGASVGLEASSVGQLDTQSEFLTQALAGLAVDDVTGLELQARVQEGVQPALEAKVNRDHRSQFASLNDAVEQQLRNKDQDSGWLGGLATYGIRPEDVGILEEVAIRELEPEELIETPAEAGVVPSEDVVSAELDRAGLAEDVKDLFQETVEEIPKTTRVYEERIRSEELVSQLDSLVADGELSPDEALQRLQFLREDTRAELRQRFQDLQDLPSGTPSGSDVEGAFQAGLIGLETFLTLLEDVDVDPEVHPFVPQQAIIDELDGDLRRAVGLGLLTEGQYTEYARTAGLDEETISQLLQGRDLDEIASDRLQDRQAQGQLAVDVVPGIGASRRAALEAADVGSVSALADSSPEDVLSVLDVSESTAREFIDRAAQLSQ